MVWQLVYWSQSYERLMLSPSKLHAPGPILLSTSLQLVMPLTLSIHFLLLSLPCHKRVLSSSTSLDMHIPLFWLGVWNSYSIRLCRPAISVRPAISMPALTHCAACCVPELVPQRAVRPCGRGLMLLCLELQPSNLVLPHRTNVARLSSSRVKVAGCISM